MYVRMNTWVCVYVEHLTNSLQQRVPEVKYMTVRPMPDSLVNKFGNIITQEDWNCIPEGVSVTDMVDAFESRTQAMVDEAFPLKKIKVSNYDKPYFTEELRELKRQRQRVYRKEGKSKKYLKLKTTFDKKLRAAVHKYKLKILKEVSDGKRTSLYSALRKIELGEHFSSCSNFSLPSHSEENLTPLQSAEKLADYFSSISQEFEPICVDKLPLRVKNILSSSSSQSKPVLEEWQVYARIKKSKKPNSTIPGDIPVKLVKEFSAEIAVPACRIFNRITESAEYPRQWVTEYQIAIPKCKPPLTEDDLKNISSTALLSKIYESFIGDWIFPFIGPFIDPAQCGGLKGSSITHYLVKLLHFVHQNLDKRMPHAVLLTLVDLEKAFNRVSHQLVIEDLADMNVPGWLLSIIISYLSGRSMQMEQLLKVDHFLGPLPRVPS